jgi:ABC-type glycerol-3-phosphate transport system substrate-binding protein
MYWKAYHTANGTLHRAYLGKTSELILDHLTNTAETLAAASVLIEPPAPDPRSAVSPTTPSHLLATKLNVPPPRAQLVMRPRLFERLNEGLCPSMRAYQVALPYATTRVEVPMTTLRRYPAGLLLIGLLLLSACGGNEPPTTGSGVAPTDTAAPDGAVRAATHAASSDGSPAAFKFDPAGYRKNAIEPGAQLRVSSWGDSSEQKVNSDSLARFNQVYPDVKIIYEPQPSDYGTKLLAQVKAGSPPDVFSLDVNLPYQLIPGNVLLDITPALTEVGRSKDDYFPNLTGVFLGKDGKVYGLPKDFTTMVLFYNTDMVKTPPKEGWTQDDFTAWVKENTTGSGQTQVFGFATDLVFFPYWGNFALANGAKVIDNGKCAINSTAGVATLDWLYGLYKDKYLTVSSNVGATWEGEAFAKKRAASIVVGGWVDPFLNDPSAAFGIHYDAVPLPLGGLRRLGCRSAEQVPEGRRCAPVVPYQPRERRRDPADRLCLAIAQGLR